MIKLALAIISVLSMGASKCVPDQTPPPYNHKTSVGASARDFLAETTYKKLYVEIQAVRGFAPSAKSIDELQKFLEQHLNKSAGVTVVLDPEIDSPGKTVYTVNDLRAVEDTHRKHFTDGDQMAAYLLFMDGASASDSQNSKILGIAHYNTSVGIFENTVHQYSGAISQPPLYVLESTVMEHEFGHLLGLVNVGTPPQSNHEDASHHGHCTQDHCLMYWATDTSDIVGNLLGGSIPTLDFDCLNDLRANGGR